MCLFCIPIDPVNIEERKIFQLSLTSPSSEDNRRLFLEIITQNIPSSQRKYEEKDFLILKHKFYTIFFVKCFHNMTKFPKGLPIWLEMPFQMI
jgi:hypothetical protein